MLCIQPATRLPRDCLLTNGSIDSQAGGHTCVHEQPFRLPITKHGYVGTHVPSNPECSNLCWGFPSELCIRWIAFCHEDLRASALAHAVQSMYLDKLDVIKICLRGCDWCCMACLRNARTCAASWLPFSPPHASQCACPTHSRHCIVPGLYYHSVQSGCRLCSCKESQTQQSNMPTP